jgi:hypothetical protein
MRKQLPLRPIGINRKQPIDLKSEHDECMPSHVARQGQKVIKPVCPMLRKASTGIETVLCGILY